MKRAFALGVLLVACSPEPLPPLGEAVIEIDTDLPVPGVVNRLRVDLYSADGRWFQHRELALPDARDWPVSFSVFSNDEGAPRDVWVRARAFPEARVRAYRGERFADWPDVLGAPPDEAEGPRLLVDGADDTPALEPEPLLAIDRLARIRLTPGERGRVPLVLRGVCAGTMAQLAAEPSGAEPGDEAAACVAAQRERQPIEPVRPRGKAAPTSERVAAWQAERCDRDDGTADRVCIPGGATILGSAEVALFPDLPPLPERIVAHRRLWIDRSEYTVARYRQANDSGFTASEPPEPRDDMLGNELSETCSYSAAPRGREDFALTCVSWNTARELCRHAGGDLPSEAQWEYAASRALVGKRRYPWGNSAPNCDDVVFGRLTLANLPGFCEGDGFGPLPVASDASGDETLDGVLGMAGGVSEWTLDRYAPYDSECWANADVREPRCAGNGARRTVRGGAWGSPPPTVGNTVRLGRDSPSPLVGFRCVYPGTST